MLIKFLKVLFVLFLIWLVIEALMLISPLFCAGVIIASVCAVIWNGVDCDGWFGEW